MNHERFDIWEEPNPENKNLPWRAQMIDYVAEFIVREAAERFVDEVKAFRKKAGLK